MENIPFLKMLEIRKYYFLLFHKDNLDYGRTGILCQYTLGRRHKNLDGNRYCKLIKNYDGYFAGRGNNNSTVDKNNDWKNGKEYELNNVIIK